MEQIIKELQHVGKTIVDKNLTFGNAGNISVKSNDSSYLITASGTKLGKLENEDFTGLTFSGETIFGKKRPSKEVPMHLAIYEERPDVKAIIHAAPFYSTMVSCTDIDIPSNFFVESMYYLERVARVPYFHPGSVELGAAVREVSKKTNVILLENHGVLVYDQSLEEALTAIQTLEYACKMLILGRGLQKEWKWIDSSTQQDFLDKSGYKPRRKWEI